MKKYFLIISTALLFGCKDGNPKKNHWNWNDNPKAICDTTLPEGIIMDTHATNSGLIITINSLGKVTRHVKDESLTMYYLINDTITHNTKNEKH